LTLSPDASHLGAIGGRVKGCFAEPGKGGTADDVEVGRPTSRAERASEVDDLVGGDADPRRRS
jgi:hypothetical protein